MIVGQQKVLCHNENQTDLGLSEHGTRFECRTSDDAKAPSCFYKTWTFWSYVVLTYLGTIGFNVGNSISDAICFDVLGEENQMKYGKQRVYGGIGFGLASLLAGYAVDYHTNDFTPAILIMLVLISIDLVVLKKLRLPKLSSSESIFKDVSKLVKNRKIAIFLAFATIAGVFDSFIFYFMFWHLEEVAERANMNDHIKLIEGITVAVECVFGEVLFFLISGKIIKKLGYIHCMSFCFSCYALRLFLISTITNPWHLVAIEALMQGCTYALCYTCIVGKHRLNIVLNLRIIQFPSSAYASVISPPGTSATVQGLVAGMDDGLGFSIGALFGGLLFQRIGGKRSFQIFSIIALVTFFAHIIFRPASTHELKSSLVQNGQAKNEKSQEIRRDSSAEEIKLTDN